MEKWRRKMSKKKERNRQAEKEPRREWADAQRLKIPANEGTRVNFSYIMKYRWYF